MKPTNRKRKNMMLKRTRAVLAGLICAVVLSLSAVGVAWADGDKLISFKQVGDAVEVTLDDSIDDVSAFSLELDVDVNAEQSDSVEIGFVFSDAITQNSKIHEYTIKDVADKTRITLYVAGGSNLIGGNLYLGKITLGLDTEKSSGAEVSVSVPEIDPTVADDPEVDASGIYALRTVNSSHIESENGVFQAEPFSALLGTWRTEEEPPAPPVEGDAEIDDDGNEEEMGPYDKYRPEDEPERNINNVKSDLSQTGDTLMPLVVTLLVVAALALVVMAFLIVRKKRS